MMDVEKISGDDLDKFFILFENYSDTSTDGGTVGNVCDLTNGHKFKAMFIMVLYSLAFVVGLLGNGLLLVVLVWSRRTWSVTDTFILHLAVSDVLLLVTLPMWAREAAQPQGWTFGTPLCKITGAVFMVRDVQYNSSCTFNDRSIL